MAERKVWKHHHHEGLVKAIENLLHAAGCPTVDVHYNLSGSVEHPRLSVTVDFSDFEDDTIDAAILWALGAHKAGGGS